MYCTDLEDLILKRHHQNKADELLILGGFISYLPVQQISKEKLNISVIYGCMKNANLNELVHKKYSKITNQSPNLKVYYKKNYNHSKIYCWIKDKNIVEVLAGSANFSISGLRNDYQEVLFDIKKEDYSETLKYVRDAIEDSELCTDHNFVRKKVVKLKFKDNNLDQIISRSPPAARLSLRSRKGTFDDSGINVGQKKLTGSNVHIDDCYVPIRSAFS